jgi:hypothetical protein
LLLFTLLATAQTPATTPARAPAGLFVIHFETGPTWQQSLPPAAQPGFGEHSANMQRLRAAGAIVFGARYAQLGMIFLKADSLDAAKLVIEADPGVRAGTFIYRIAPLSVFYPWQQ